MSSLLLAPDAVHRLQRHKPLGSFQCALSTAIFILVSRTFHLLARSDRIAIYSYTAFSGITWLLLDRSYHEPELVEPETGRQSRHGQFAERQSDPFTIIYLDVWIFMTPGP
ncbi:hypothetical protein F5883DRAFT_654362 [Diaporthe sp. PMI_573]|nr:hypothetical protein F5883DRAFT_654362 [Diaporthaceae sp. PMI_573]